jgi:hypothetical protein
MKKTFPDNHKLKQLMSTKPALQKTLKGILHTDKEERHKHEKSEKNKFYEWNR